LRYSSVFGEVLGYSACTVLWIMLRYGT
jgi:hypothetical protein